jgi:hypothetical protein
MAVEPTRWQNSTVRWRRSPAADLVSDAGSVGGAGAASAKAPPHSPQNLSPGWLVAPHFGHEVVSGAPQRAQNLRPSRLSLLHCEQRIYAGKAKARGVVANIIAPSAIAAAVDRSATRII